MSDHIPILRHLYCVLSSMAYTCVYVTEIFVVYTVHGFHAGTIFVYGQTSSGKTYTMMGRPQHPGIIPLSIEGICEYIESVSACMHVLWKCWLVDSRIY